MTFLSTAAMASASFLVLSASMSIAAPERTCKCRSSKSGSYLEMLTTHDDGRMVVSGLESFTMNGKANASHCQTALKKRPECNGLTAAAPATPAPSKGVKLAPKEMNEAFYEIGLLPNDYVLNINKVAVKSERDFAKIADAKKNGGRVDVEVQRGDRTVNMWFDFPKPDTSTED